jgi:hypothetical protein
MCDRLTPWKQGVFFMIVGGGNSTRRT